MLAEETLGGLPLLTVEGDLDRVVALRLQEALLEHTLRGRRRLLIDMRRCTSIDSGGLAAIFGALNEVTNRGWLGMIGVNGAVRRVLRTVGLTDHERLILFDDEKDVLRSLPERI